MAERAAPVRCMKGARTCSSALSNCHGEFLRDLWIGYIQRLINSDGWEMEGLDFLEISQAALLEMSGVGRSGDSKVESKGNTVMRNNGKMARGK